MVKKLEDVTSYLKENPAPDLSFVTDCAFPVCHGEKGICRVELISERLDGNMILAGGSASNSIPAYASAEIRLADGGQKTIQTKGISGHAAFPLGAKNALGILAMKIADECTEACILSEREKAVLEFLKKACGEGFGRELNIDCEDHISGVLTASGTVVKAGGKGLFLGWISDIRLQQKQERSWRSWEMKPENTGFPSADMRMIHLLTWIRIHRLSPVLQRPMRK